MLAAACGDDSGGGGVSTEAFCAELERIDANADIDIEDPEALAEFTALAERAPEEVRGAMQEFAEIANRLEGLDDDDPEAFGAAFALFGDPDFLQALKTVSLFMADDCGLEVDGIDEIRELDPDDPSSLFGDFGTEGGGGADDDLGLGLDGSGDDGAPGDDFGGGGGFDDGPSPSEQLGDFLDANYSETSWADDIVSKGIGTSGDNVSVTVSFASSGVSESDALAACDAVVEWAGGHYDSNSNVDIIISDGDGEVALAEDGVTCVPA